MTISLKLGKKKHDDLLEFARDVAKALRNNPNFSDGDQWADNIDNALTLVVNNDDNIETMLIDVRGLRTDKRQLVKQLKEVLTNTARSVESASEGDQKMIESANMALKRTPVPVGKMPVVKGLDTSYSAPGELLLKWATVKGAVSYALQAKNLSNPEATFAIVTITTASQVVLGISIDEEGLDTKKGIGIDDEGVQLKRGAAYVFRVAAIGAAGQGPWSDSIERIAT